MCKENENDESEWNKSWRPEEETPRLSEPTVLCWFMATVRLVENIVYETIDVHID